jgi:hypothetical protein
MLVQIKQTQQIYNHSQKQAGGMASSQPFKKSSHLLPNLFNFSENVFKGFFISALFNTVTK